MSTSTLAAAVNDLVKSGRPVTSQIGAILARYLSTEDHGLVSSLPGGLVDWDLRPIFEALDPGAAETGRMMDFFALSIRESNARVPVDEDRLNYGVKPAQSPIDDFAVVAVEYLVRRHYGKSETWRSEVLDLLLQASDRMDVGPLQLAKLSIAGGGTLLPFGWRDDDDSDGAAMYRRNCPPVDTGSFDPLEQRIWALGDDDMTDLLNLYHEAPDGRFSDRAFPTTMLQGALARLRSAPFIAYLDGIDCTEKTNCSVAWSKVLLATEEFDQRAVAYAAMAPPRERFSILRLLHESRGEAHADLAREAALVPKVMVGGGGLEWLSKFFPEDATACLLDALDHSRDLSGASHSMEDVFRAAAICWDAGGERAFTKFAGLTYEQLPAPRHHTGHSMYADAMSGLLAVPELPTAADPGKLLERMVKSIGASEADGKTKNEILGGLWEVVSEQRPELFVEELWSVMENKLKSLRDMGIAGLKKAVGATAVPRAAELLGAKRADVRIAAADFLGALGDPVAQPALQAALGSETSDKVRAAMQKALESCGVALPVATEPRECSLEELEAMCEKDAKKLKLPKGDWLDLAALPPLPTTSGEPLSELGLTFLIAKQAKHKTIEPTPDVVPLLAHFDRAATTDFALALFEKWLASPQVAADRWVLVLVGVLADKRGISVLKAPIQSWADNSRHKMAEYAAQAIALIPGDEALTILDGLANRYRSKYKNIGRACREALEAAALARGVSLDDLADLIVPDFGFDADRQRTFTWDDGELIAVMGPDSKFSWINPETDKETKAMPAATPDEVKTEVKALNKLLRESIKGQTARLELCLVRQRRWTVARWQELFEVNPLLQSFAARLVWGVYDEEGLLQRTFRRYPNGILADAGGEMVELENVAGFVGIIHPLELDDEALSAWREHLGRMKVKPPFPQLDRPVARLDPQHGNRKEIGVADKVCLSYGTFRSRAEKRGWQRGSVVDAGGISSYCKVFPGAGVEVYLFTEDIYIGCDPMDPMTLGVAYFAKAGSVEVGSYTYDEPGSGDDPRVLSFGQVPPVVYSETISDLEAIVEGQAS
jgi:hypothetical protein